MVGSEQDHADEQQQQSMDQQPDSIMMSRLVPHEDKVEMQKAEIEQSPSSSIVESSPSDSSNNEEREEVAATSTEGQSEQTTTPAEEEGETEEEPVQTETETETETTQIETGSRVVQRGDGDGFTPTYSDDDSSSSTITTIPSSSPSSSDATTTPSSDSTTPSDDTPRFKQQSKRSVTNSMSAGKQATNSAEATVEVTEFDDSVQGGKRINEDDDSSSPKEQAQ